MTRAIRLPLPQRRPHESFSIEHWGVTFNVGLGRYLDGRLGEVFITAEKVGTQSDVMARDAAVLLSLALQHGIELNALRHAITRDANNDASGLVGKLLDMLAAEESHLERAVGGLG